MNTQTDVNHHAVFIAKSHIHIGDSASKPIESKATVFESQITFYDTKI
jgi:hypothetical protein